MAIQNIRVHEKSCYLNPINIRLCEVCNKVIKNKGTRTCSFACSNIRFHSGENHGNWKNFRSICFLYHKKECIICKEKNIVEVHHMDENKKNTNPENLVPLCPTHHKYWHSGFRSKVESKVLEYLSTWKTVITEDNKFRFKDKA